MSYKKFKDLEDNIKSESTKIDAPDVYSNVKDTPIRKLNKGEKPSKYFSRKAGLAVLAFLVLIVVILSVLLLAMVLSDTNTPLPSYPAIVSFEKNVDSVNTSYIFLCENTTYVKAAINITDGSIINNFENMTIDKAVSTLLDVKANNSYSLGVLTNKNDLSQQITNDVRNQINTNFGETAYTINNVSATDTKQNIISFLNSRNIANPIDEKVDISFLFENLSQIAENNL